VNGALKRNWWCLASPPLAILAPEAPVLRIAASPCAAGSFQEDCVMTTERKERLFFIFVSIFAIGGSLVAIFGPVFNRPNVAPQLAQNIAQASAIANIEALTLKIEPLPPATLLEPANSPSLDDFEKLLERKLQERSKKEPLPATPKVDPAIPDFSLNGDPPASKTVPEPMAPKKADFIQPVPDLWLEPNAAEIRIAKFASETFPVECRICKTEYDVSRGWSAQHPTFHCYICNFNMQLKTANKLNAAKLRELRAEASQRADIH
jgi:hypothetical protein